jgi:hypothetical protein
VSPETLLPRFCVLAFSILNPLSLPKMDASNNQMQKTGAMAIFYAEIPARF